MDEARAGVYGSTIEPVIVFHSDFVDDERKVIVDIVQAVIDARSSFIFVLAEEVENDQGLCGQWSRALVPVDRTYLPPFVCMAWKKALDSLLKKHLRFVFQGRLMSCLFTY